MCLVSRGNVIQILKTNILEHYSQYYDNRRIWKSVDMESGIEATRRTRRTSSSLRFTHCIFYRALSRLPECYRENFQNTIKFYIIIRVPNWDPIDSNRDWDRSRPQN